MRSLALALVLTTTAAAQSSLPATRIRTIVAARVGDPQLSPDRQHVYYVVDTTSLMMYDRVTGKETRLASAGGLSDLTRAGDRLVYGRNDETGDGSYLWTLAVDPRTGLATEAPRRVTMTKGDNASFSPDGKRIAFTSAVSKTEDNLVVVPTLGGPETIVARIPGKVWPIRWSPDGNELFFSINDHTGAGGAPRVDGIYRVAVAGGKPSLVVRAASWAARPGLSPDGTLLMYWNTRFDTLVVRSVAGKQVAAFPSVGPNAYPDTWGDGRHGVEAQSRIPRYLSGYLIATGATKLLTDSLGGHEEAVYSPDGRRVAMIDVDSQAIAVINSDGSGRRSYHALVSVSSNPTIWWSPDGKSIVYQSSARPFPLAMVDLASGKQQHVAAVSSLESVRWLSDGRGILYLAPQDTSKRDSVRTIVIHEKIFGGRDIAVRSLTLICPGGPCWSRFVNDSQMVTWNAGKYSLQSVKTGGARVVYDRGNGTRQPNATFSANGAWMAVRRGIADQEPRQIDVMRIDGTSLKSVKFDYATSPGLTNPFVSADGNTLLVVGGNPRDGAVTVNRVDVASGKSTPLTTIRKDDRPQQMRIWFAPDGGSFVYSTRAARRWTLLDIDLTGLYGSKR